MRDVAIRVTEVTKDYEVYNRPLDLALEVLTRRPRHIKFRALDSVTFEVQRGEVFGVIGSNGAGKSTLLKIITGVLDATSGSVEVSGRITAILELGLGFNPEYSGRENIYLSGLLYGMGKAEVDRKLDSIVEFSGLGDFIERPVKTYSSGMHARLAFSIATAVEPDILIIDEALAAGDAAFVQKCLRRIRELCSGGRTVLLVSHGTGIVAQLCNRAMWINHGRVRAIGPAIQVVQAYDLAAHQAADTSSWIEAVDDNLSKATSRDMSGAEATVSSGNAADATDGATAFDGAPAEPSVDAAALPNLTDRTAVEAHAAFQHAGETGRQVFRRGPVFIDGVELYDDRGQLTTHLTLLKKFKLKVHYHVNGPLPDPTLGVALAINNRYDLVSVAQFMTQNIRPTETRETYDNARDRFPAARRGTITLSFDYVPFRKGDYILSIGLVPNQPASWQFYEYRHLYYAFSVDDAGMDIGAPILLRPTVTHLEKVDGDLVPDDQVPGLPECTTLRQEIEKICVVDGQYPDRWPRHDCCPACNGGGIVSGFAKYGFTHSQCISCGFTFVDPYPVPKILRQLYSGLYYSRTRSLFEKPLLSGEGAELPFSAPRAVLEEVIRRATEGKSKGAWLEVGGGLGAFAHLIQTQLPDWTVSLNEYNPQSIAIARESFDFEVVMDDPAELLRSGRSFDVVSSVAVLEHIPTPYDFLKSYAALVTPGGWLITVVPNFSPLNRAVSRGSSANVVPPFHVSLFGETSLRSLLERIDGFEIAAIEQAGPAAFQLIHHVDFGDHWDVEIPTLQHPVPRSIQVTPYDTKVGQVLNVLSEADATVGDYFSETDGRLLLIAYCRRI